MKKRPCINCFLDIKHPDEHETQAGYYFYDDTWYGPFKTESDAQNVMDKHIMKKLR